MKNKVLIMISGGIDSVGVAYIVLTDPKYSNFDVYLHHLHLLNCEGRYEAEKEAVENIVMYLKTKGYNFEYSSSIHDYNFMKNQFIWDLDIVWFMAGVICQTNHSITHIATGRTKSDTLNFGEAVEDRRKRGEKIFEDLVKTKARKVIPQFLPVVADMTKKEIMDILPEDLLSLTWSCRTPVSRKSEWIPCGVCITCKEIIEIKEN
jgi:7-cyano-7-deazaguanine synthase in queuosine biosynthesis